MANKNLLPNAKHYGITSYNGVIYDVYSDKIVSIDKANRLIKKRKRVEDKRLQKKKKEEALVYFRKKSKNGKNAPVKKTSQSQTFLGGEVPTDHLTQDARDAGWSTTPGKGGDVAIRRDPATKTLIKENIFNANLESMKSKTKKADKEKIIPVKKNGTGGGGGGKGKGKGEKKSGNNKKIPHGQSSYPSPLITDKIPAVLKNKFKTVTTGTGGIFDYRRGAGVGIADTALNLALAGINGIANKARIEKYVKAHGGKAKNIDYSTNTFKRTQNAQEQARQQALQAELGRKVELENLKIAYLQAQTDLKNAQLSNEKGKAKTAKAKMAEINARTAKLLKDNTATGKGGSGSPLDLSKFGIK